jgi:hypothetical protein
MEATDDNAMRIRPGAFPIHNDYHMSDPAQPYREIVADMLMKVWPDIYGRSNARNSLVLLDSDYSRTTSTSTLGSETPQLMQYFRLPGPALLLSTHSTPRRFKPRTYMETRYKTIGNLKSVQSQDTADDPAEPSLDSDDAEAISPHQAEENPTSQTLLPQRSPLIGNVRRTGAHHNASASRSVATSAHKPPNDFLHSESARSAAKDELPVYRPVKNVPVRKGWVKKVAEAIAKRGQNE